MRGRAFGYAPKKRQNTYKHYPALQEKEGEGFAWVPNYFITEMAQLLQDFPHGCIMPSFQARNAMCLGIIKGIEPDIEPLVTLLEVDTKRPFSFVVPF